MCLSLVQTQLALFRTRRGMGASTHILILEIISKIHMNICHNKFMKCEVLSTFYKYVNRGP